MDELKIIAEFIGLGSDLVTIGVGLVLVRHHMKLDNHSTRLTYIEKKVFQ